MSLNCFYFIVIEILFKAPSFCHHSPFLFFLATRYTVYPYILYILSLNEDKDTHHGIKQSQMNFRDMDVLS